MFKADIFTNSIPIFKKSNFLEEELLKEIIEKYNNKISLKNIYVEQFYGNEINSNNYKVTTDSGVYLIKKFINIQSYQLNKISDIHRWLIDNDVKVFKIYSCNKGNFILDYKNDNSFWSIYDFVEGDFYTGKSDIEIISVASETGIFFNKLKRIPNKLYPTDKINHFDNKDIINKMEKYQKKWSMYFGEQLASRLNTDWLFLKTTYEKILKNKDLLLSKELSPSHIDLHPHNILITNNILKSFLDFDSIKLEYSLVSISFSIYKLLKQSIISRDIKNNSKEIERILNLYLDSFCKYFVIDTQDMKYLSLYASVEIFRRIFIIFSLNIDDNTTTWNHVLEIHLDGLKEIEIIFNGLNIKNRDKV